MTRRSRGDSFSANSSNVIPLQARNKKAPYYFPDALKRHYLDLLRQLKEQQSVTSGKRVGWLTIRDQIMKPEDDELAASLSAHKHRIDVESTRPRSAMLELNDLKGWFNPKTSHLPSDVKFQYIDRFIRSIRLAGELDAIEHKVRESEREYLREAMLQFCRPKHASSAQYEKHIGKTLDDHLAALDTASFVGITDNDDKERQSCRSRCDQIVFVMLCHKYRHGTLPFDLVACFVPSHVEIETDTTYLHTMREKSEQVAQALFRLQIVNLPMVPIFSGFLIVESFPHDMSLKTILHLTKPSNAHSSHEGLAKDIGRYQSVPAYVVVQNDGQASIGWNHSFPTPGFGKLMLKIPEQACDLHRIREKFSGGYSPC